jgi:hypothetical protein
MLCADICNSLKHLRLSRSRSGENPSFGATHYKLDVNSGVISFKHQVVTDSGSVDAFELATNCVGAWDVFLNKQGLRSE